MYNTLGILKKNMSNTELEELADWIDSLPKYASIECEGRKYMMAHAMTVPYPEVACEQVFIMGEGDFLYMENGIPGYISVIGHTTTDYIRFFMGEERENKNSIWINRKKNLYAIDCACGFGNPSSRLACLRLNDFAEFYV